MSFLPERFLVGIPGIRIRPGARTDKVFHTLILACFLAVILSGNAHAMQALDCAISGTCQSQFWGTIHVGTGTVTIPVQYVPSANPQQPATYYINSPGMPQNLTVPVPPSISMFGFVTFEADPFIDYAMTFVNNTGADAVFDLVWTTDVSGNPYHWAYSSLQVDTTAGGTAGAKTVGAYMQTATFESASNWLLPLATGACANTSCGFTAGVDFGGTSTVPKIDLALDFTLSAGGTAYIQGFAGLDQRSPSQGTPEPSSVCLIASGLAAVVLRRRGSAVRRHRVP